MFHMEQVIIQKSQEDFDQYIRLLKEWQKAVNLVAPSTLSDIWNRHIIDSAQLFQLIPSTAQCLVDMGSGAGFPGLVLAILNKNNNGPLKEIILIESDTKKSLFLKEVVRVLNLPVQIINQRIEKIKNIKADVITARALASVSQLLAYARPFYHQTTSCLFLKGKNVDEELEKCSYACRLERIKSITNSNSSILKISEVKYD